MEEDNVDFGGIPRQSIPMEGCKAVDICDDSMDIYEDLAYPSSPLLFKQDEGRLEFDFLEELLVEETSGRVRTIEELSQKLEESQKQIVMLTKNIKVVQEKNAVLLTQNEQLKKNLCALFKTAKAEIDRKNMEIQRLKKSLTGVPGSWRKRTAQPEEAQDESRSAQSSPPATVVASLSRHNGQHRRGLPESAEAVKPDSYQPDRKRADSTTQHCVYSSDKTSMDSSAKTRSDQPESLRADRSKSRLVQSDMLHSDQTKSRLDRSDELRGNISEKSSGDRSDKSRVDQSDKSRVDQSDRSRVDQFDRSRVDQSDRSRVHQSEKSRVDQSDRSRVHQSDKSRVDQSEKSRVDQSDRSRVDQSDRSRVDQSDRSRVHQSEKSRVDQSEKSRVDQSDRSRVHQSDKSRVDHAERSRVDQSDRSRVHQSKSRVDQSEKSRVDQSDRSRVHQSDKSRVDHAERSRVDQSDRSRVHQSKSRVDQSEKSRVDRSDRSRADQSKSRVDQSDKSRVDQSTSRAGQSDNSHVDHSENSRGAQSKSGIDHSDTSRVDHSEKSRVDQSDKSRLDHSEKSRADQSKSRVDQSEKSCVDQSEKSRLDHSEKSRADQSKSRADQSKSHVDQPDRPHVDQSGKSRVYHSDKPSVDQSDKSRIDHSTSCVDQSEKSCVDQSEKSRLDHSEKSRADQSKSRADQSKSHVDQPDRPHVDQSGKSRVYHSDKPSVDQSDKSRIDHSDKPSVDQSDKSRVDHSTSRVDQSEKSCVDQSEKSRLDHSEKSRADQSKLRADQSKSHVDQPDRPHVDQSGKSRVDHSDKPSVDQSDKSRIDHSDKPSVDQSDKSRVDHSTSRVDQSEKSCVDQSDISRIDHSDKSRVDHSDKSRVDHSDKPSVDQSDKSRVDHSKSHADHSKSHADQSEKSCVDQFDKSHVDHSDKPSVDQFDKSLADQSGKSRVDQPAKSCVEQFKSYLDQSNNSPSAHLDLSCAAQFDMPHSNNSNSRSDSCETTDSDRFCKPHVDKYNSCLEQSKSSLVQSNTSCLNYFKMQSVQPEQLHVFQSAKTSSDQSNQYSDPSIKSFIEEPISCSDQASQLHLDKASIQNLTQSSKQHCYLPETHSDDASKAQLHQSEGPYFDHLEKSSSHHPEPHIDHAAKLHPGRSVVLCVDKAVDSTLEQPIQPNALKVLNSEALHRPDQHIESVANTCDQDGPIATPLSTPQAPPVDHQLVISQPEVSSPVELKDKADETLRPEQVSQAQTQATDGSARKKSVNRAVPRDGATDDSMDSTTDLRARLRALALDRLSEGDNENKCSPSELGTSEQSDETRSAGGSGESAGRGERVLIAPSSHGSQLAAADRVLRTKGCEGSRDGINEEGHKGGVRQLKSIPSHSGFADATTTGHTVDYPKHGPHRNDKASEQRCHGSKGSKRRDGERKAKHADDLAGCSLVSEVRRRRNGSAEKYNARHKTKIGRRGTSEGRDCECSRGDSLKNMEDSRSPQKEVISSASRKKISADKERNKERLRHNGGSAVRTPRETQGHNHSERANNSPNDKSNVRKSNSAQDVVGICNLCSGALPDDLPSVAEDTAQRQRWACAGEQLSFSVLSEFAQQSRGVFSWCLTPKVATKSPYSPPDKVVEESSSVAEELNLDNSASHQPDSMEDMIVLDEVILEISRDSESKVDRNGGSDCGGSAGDGSKENVEVLHEHSNTTVDKHGCSVEHSEMSAKQDNKDTSALVQQEFSKSPSDAVALAADQSSQSTEHHSQPDDVAVDERNVAAVTSGEQEAVPVITEAVQTPKKRVGSSREEASKLKQSKVTFMSSLSLTLSPQRGIRAKHQDSGGAVVPAAMAVAAAPVAVLRSSSKSASPVSMVERAEDTRVRGKHGADRAADDATKTVLSGHPREESHHAAGIPQQNSSSVKESTSDKLSEAEDDGPEEGEIVSDTEPENVPKDTSTPVAKLSSCRANCATTTTPTTPAAATTTTAITTVTTVAVPIRHDGKAASFYSSVSPKQGGNGRFPRKLAQPNGGTYQKHGHRLPNRSCRQEFNKRKRSCLYKHPQTAMTKQAADRNKNTDMDCPASTNQQPGQSLTMQSILNELENIQKRVHIVYYNSSIHTKEPTMDEILEYAEKQSVDMLNKFNWSGQDDSKMELCSLIRKSIGQLKDYPNIECLFSGQSPHEKRVLLDLLDKEFDILFNNIRYTLCLQQLGNRPQDSTTVATRHWPAGTEKESKNKQVKSIPWKQYGTMSSRDKREEIKVSPKNAVGGNALSVPLRSALSPLATTGVNANYKIPKFSNRAVSSPVERRDPACVQRITDSVALVPNATLQSPKLGDGSIREPQSQLKRKMCLEVEVIRAPVKKATPVRKRRKMDLEGNVGQMVECLESVAGYGDNCGSATKKKTEVVSSGGESGSDGRSGRGIGGSDRDDVIGRGDFVPESVVEDVETTSVELDECPVTPGKSMFGPDVDKGSEAPDGLEASPVEELQIDDKSPTEEIPQKPLPLSFLKFTLCTESNMGEELLSLLGKKQQILQELSMFASPEVTNYDLKCDSMDVNVPKSGQLKNPDSPNSMCNQTTNWIPTLSSILLADLEVSNSLLSPLKESYKPDSSALVSEKRPLPSDGQKFVPLPVACYSENAQFDEDESDFRLAVDTDSPSEGDESGQTFSPLKNMASKKEFVDSVAQGDPQSHECGEVHTAQRLHSGSEVVSKKRQLPAEEECDRQNSKEEDESSGTQEPHDCKRWRHSMSSFSDNKNGKKKKCKKPIACKTNVVTSPESEEQSLAPALKTKHKKKKKKNKSIEKNKSAMSASAEGLTPSKGHRRASKKTNSMGPRGTKASVNVAESGEVPQHKGKKRPGCGRSPHKVILAKNVVKKHGEVVLLWTRDDDRLILSEVQRHGAAAHTFSSIAALLGTKTRSQVSHRFRELLKLFQKAAAAADSVTDEASGSEGDSDVTLQSDCESSEASVAAHTPRS